MKFFFFSVIDVMVLQSPVNSASKSVLLTKKTKMANFYAGYAPCLTRGLWYEQSSLVGSNIAEFSKQTKTGKKRKKKRGTYNFDNFLKSCRIGLDLLLLDLTGIPCYWPMFELQVLEPIAGLTTRNTSH